MTPQPHDWSWLDASETISVSDLSRVCGISTDELDELVEYGVLRPSARSHWGGFFVAECLHANRQHRSLATIPKCLLWY